jgi:hypothetical protein
MSKRVRQVTREEALEIDKRGDWKNWTDEQIVAFQLWQDRLCMDFGRFHEAVEKILGRSVWTHEFADPDKLRLECMKVRKAPSLTEIFNMLPKDKTIIAIVK